MKEAYLTIQADGQNEIEIKKSRFICHLARVLSEEEASDFIKKIKKEHYKANHNCAAFLIGEQDQIQRAFDDGEPVGTAGVPMLEVLKKQCLKNTVAVVTRYFGGTKLGASGLIRAYGHAVAAGIETVGLVQIKQQQEVKLVITYGQLNSVEHFFREQQLPIVDQQFLERITLTTYLDLEQIEPIHQELISLLRNQLTFSTGTIRLHEQPYHPI